MNFIKIIIVFIISLNCLNCNDNKREDRVSIENDQIDSIIKSIVNINTGKFPPADNSVTTFTINYQNYIKKYRKGAIIFKGFLEDIEESNDTTFAYFKCYTSDHILDDGTISFKLSISPHHLVELLKKDMSSSITISLQRWNKPDFYVLANIDDFKSIQTSFLEGYIDENKNISVESNLIRHSVGFGKLLKLYRPSDYNRQ